MQWPYEVLCWSSLMIGFSWIRCLALLDELSLQTLPWLFRRPLHVGLSARTPNQGLKKGDSYFGRIQVTSRMKLQGVGCLGFHCNTSILQVAFLSAYLFCCLCHSNSPTKSDVLRFVRCSGRKIRQQVLSSHGPPIELRFAMGHCMVLCAATLSSLGAFLFGVLASRFPLENFAKNSFHHPVMDILGCSTLPVGGFHDPLLQVEIASFQQVASTTNLESTLKTRIRSSKVTWYVDFAFRMVEEWVKFFQPAFCCWGLDIGYIAPILECWSFKRDVAHLTNSSQEIGSVTAGFIATRQLAEVVGGARKLPWVWKGPMVVFGVCRAVGLYRVMWSCFGLDAFWFWITLIDMY